MAKITMDASAATHVSQRIKERIEKEDDQKKMIEAVKKLIGVTAPDEAVGQYQYHLKIGSIGRIILRGIMIRTIYSFNENYPNSPEYKISGGKLVKA